MNLTLQGVHLRSPLRRPTFQRLLLALLLSIASPLYAQSSAPFLVINELKANLPDDELSLEFIELRGTPGMTLEMTYLLIIDGDEGDTGTLDYVRDLSGVTVGSNGLIFIKHPSAYDAVPTATTVINDPALAGNDEDGKIEHDTITFMLVRSPVGFREGDDLDTNDDGILDGLPREAVILDTVGWIAGAGFAYTNVLLTQSASDPDAATRFADDITPNALEAWTNGDIFEDPAGEDPFDNRYDPSQASNNLPPGAALTPGAPNFVRAPFVLLSEVVVNPPSSNGALEYIELIGGPYTDLNGVQIVVIEGHSHNRTAQPNQPVVGSASPRTTRRPMPITYARSLNRYRLGLTGLLMLKNARAYRTVPPNVTVVNEPQFSGMGALGNQTLSIVLLYSPNRLFAVGDTLDANQDGQLDDIPGVQVLDAINWVAHPTDRGYGSVTLTQPRGTPAAATRLSGNRSASASAWVNGDLLRGTDGRYNPANASANLPADAFVSPGTVNIAAQGSARVIPTRETARTTADRPDADDPAFWIHPTDPARSLIFATQKLAGYSIYDANARTVQDVKPDNVRYNNVDVLYDFPLNGQLVDLAVFSDRTSDKLVIYAIQDTAPYLINVTDPTMPFIFSGRANRDTAYGLGLYKSPRDGAFYAFVSQNDSYLVKQLRLMDHHGKVGWQVVRTLELTEGDDDEHAEGIVADQELGIVYIAQEDVAVYRFNAEPDGGNDFTIVAEEGDELIADIEGVGLYYLPNGQGYLLVSSQGGNTFAVYERQGDNAYIGSFAVIDNGQIGAAFIDGSQECDGLDLTNVNIGPHFPQGALIVHDGQDSSLDPDDNATNFKWIPWPRVAEALNLEINPTYYHPRFPHRGIMR